MKKNMFYGVLILLIITVSAAVYLYRAYNRRIESVAAMTVDFTGKATDLLHEFSLQAKATNGKYQGKIIELTGPVKGIEKDTAGFYTISLGDTAALSSVRCSMQKEGVLVADHLKIGMTTTIRGICIGYMADDMGLGSDIIINRAIIIK